MTDLSDIFAEEEARLVAEAEADRAKEAAAWAALTPEERAARSRAFEAKYEAMFDIAPDDADEDEDEDEED